MPDGMLRKNRLRKQNAAGACYMLFRKVLQGVDQQINSLLFSAAKLYHWGVPSKDGYDLVGTCISGMRQEGCVCTALGSFKTTGKRKVLAKGSCVRVNELRVSNALPGFACTCVVQLAPGFLGTCGVEINDSTPNGSFWLARRELASPELPSGRLPSILNSSAEQLSLKDVFSFFRLRYGRDSYLCGKEKETRADKRRLRVLPQKTATFVKDC
ncbi:hypothetical protein M513_06365 [Trichuris suis]|uniref:Uncharacterized protein n=1 Tax=Trichuris suis TaxID=68888 RepID=A0A085M663_9BILA|nr:hypothetical protein M513_06365 [Trichuris suis]